MAQKSKKIDVLRKNTKSLSRLDKSRIKRDEFVQEGNSVAKVVAYERPKVTELEERMARQIKIAEEHLK